MILFNMFNCICYYLFRLRKIIVHFCTGKCELERAADIQNFIMFGI